MATIKQASISIRQNKGKDLSPSWDDAINWNEEKFNRQFREAMTFYRLESNVKELKPKLIIWMSRSEFKKDEIELIKKTKDKYFNGTMLGVAAALLKGMPEQHKEFNKGRNSAEWLKSQIKEVSIKGANDLEEDEASIKIEQPAVPSQSIQEKIRDVAGDMCEELDSAIDSYIANPDEFDPKAFKVLNLLRGKGCKPAHARYIKGFFKFAHEELLELASGNADDQLRESYKRHPRKNIRKLIEFYDSIMSACDQLSAEAKITRKPRAKKTKPAEQLVSKMKFCIKDDTLGIVSVPPAQLVGAQAAIIYNVKTRKIAHVISKTSSGLSVKGTSLLEFTEKSMQKTLRKPAEQLKEFKEQSTQKRFETWFNKITTTDTLFSGRMNEDSIILKVFK